MIKQLLLGFFLFRIFLLFTLPVITRFVIEYFKVYCLLFLYPSPPCPKFIVSVVSYPSSRSVHFTTLLPPPPPPL